MNPTNTQVMWLVSSQQLAKLDISHVRVLSSCVKVQDTARDLGVVIDSQLSLSAHVTAVCRSGYYQLRQLRQAVRSLSEDASKTLVQVFVSCRLDFCNSLFFGISEGLMNRLHQNAAARLVTGTRRSDHISPVLRHDRQLHWLPVHQRVDFKVATAHSYTSRCLAFHHRTWPTTAVLSPMLVNGDCVPLRAEHA